MGTKLTYFDFFYAGLRTSKNHQSCQIDSQEHLGRINRTKLNPIKWPMPNNSSINLDSEIRSDKAMAMEAKLCDDTCMQSDWFEIYIEMPLCNRSYTEWAPRVFVATVLQPLYTR